MKTGESRFFKLNNYKRALGRESQFVPLICCDFSPYDFFYFSYHHSELRHGIFSI
ncbi:MAG: hypothetical protein U9N18_07370 [Campylobacterota bacterium]|nr:hypothetical protein [Campylobacterota bacterium]